MKKPKLGVIYRYHNREQDLFAVFPDSLSGNMIECYSRIGQHSLCSVDYYRESRPAKEIEFNNLHAELKAIYWEYELVFRKRLTNQ